MNEHDECYGANMPAFEDPDGDAPHSCPEGSVGVDK